MPTFIVSTAILRPINEPRACAIGAPKMLMNAGVRYLQIRSCYCCSDFGSVVFVVDSDSRGDILDAFNRINVPIASIMEAEEIKQVAMAPSTA